MAGRVGEPGWPCGRRGRCSLTSGSCGCYTGHAGPDCGECARGYARVDEHCVPLITETRRPWWSEWGWLLILLGVLLCCCSWCGVVAMATRRPGSPPEGGVGSWLLAGHGRMAVDKSHLAVLEPHHTQPRAVQAMSKARGRNARTAAFVRPDRMARGPRIRRATCSPPPRSAGAVSGRAEAAVNTQQQRVRSLLRGNGTWRGRRGASVDGAVARTAGRLLAVGSDGRLRQRPGISTCDSFEPCALSPMESVEKRPLPPQNSTGSARDGSATQLAAADAASHDSEDTHLLALEDVSGGIMEQPLLEATRRHLRSLHDADVHGTQANARNAAFAPAQTSTTEQPVTGDLVSDRHRGGPQGVTGPAAVNAVGTVVTAAADGQAAGGLQHIRQGADASASCMDVGGRPRPPRGNVVIREGPETELDVDQAEGEHEAAAGAIVAEQRRRSSPGAAMATGDHHPAAQLVAEAQNRPAKSAVVGGLRARFSAPGCAQQDPGAAAPGRDALLQPKPGTAGAVDLHHMPHGHMPSEQQAIGGDSFASAGREVGHRHGSSHAGVAGGRSRQSRPGITVEENISLDDNTDGRHDRPDVVDAHTGPAVALGYVGPRGARASEIQPVDTPEPFSAVSVGNAARRGAGVSEIRPAGTLDLLGASYVGHPRRRAAGVSEIRPAEKPESLLFELLGHRHASPYSQLEADRPAGPHVEPFTRSREDKASLVRRSRWSPVPVRAERVLAGVPEWTGGSLDAMCELGFWSSATRRPKPS